MTFKAFLFLVGSVGALALAACGSSSGSSPLGSAGSAGSASSAGGMGGTGGNRDANCSRLYGDGGSSVYFTPSCMEAINRGGVPCAVDTAGLPAYNALVACASSSCASDCAALIMSQGAADTACTTCLTSSCASELTTCNHDPCYPGNCQ